MAELITESMVLPSAGSGIYGSNFDGHLMLRAMTTEEERMRLSGQSFYYTMSTIMNECICDNKNPDGTYKIDSKMFTDFDFFAVCVKLRIISYGNKYRTTAICPVCGHEFEFKADLADLVYNTVPFDFNEPYTIGPLPSSGDTLGCRFLRIKDHMDIEKQKDLFLAKNPNYMGDPTYNMEMEKRIVAVNGKELDYLTAGDYVKHMIAMDNYVYHEKIDQFPFGVVRLNMTECQNPKGCTGTAIWVLKADREFFRPCLDD